MGWSIGGRLVAEKLDALRDALYDYYGTLNELRTALESQPQLASTIVVPQKPEALVLWEQCNEMNLPLVAGGAMDQPHIWLEEWAIVREVYNLFNPPKS